ncbi:MAG: hypothetical protein AB2602_01525, partial [Candidatus Thiodiazotropha sp.]
PEPEPEVKSEEEGSWVSALIWFGVINLLLIGGGAAYWWFFIRNKRAMVSLVDENASKAGVDEAVENG